MTTPGCESCGRDEPDLVAVIRQYVVPEAWDQEGSVSEAEDAERWCFSCRTQYPHRPIDDSRRNSA